MTDNESIIAFIISVILTAVWWWIFDRGGPPVGCVRDRDRWLQDNGFPTGKDETK